MQALHPVNHDARPQHGIVFNAVAYTCGGVYAVGQLALQGLGKCWEASWDIGYELGANSWSGLNEIGKGVSATTLHLLCTVRMIWGCVSPFFVEGWQYTCANFNEMWKILKDLPQAVLCLIEIPGSLVGGILWQLCSESGAGCYQLSLFAQFAFEVIKQLRDFGTIGAIIKDTIQLLESGMNQLIQLIVKAWKETAIPRENAGDLLWDFAHCFYVVGNENFKLWQSFGESILNVTSIPNEQLADLSWDLLFYLFFGVNQLFIGFEEIYQSVSGVSKIPLDIVMDWLKECGGYLLAALWEVIKLYDATTEDIGNTWKNMIVDPLSPYAEHMRQRIGELLVEIEKAVVEVQKMVFG